MAEVEFDKKWPFITLGFEIGKHVGDEVLGECVFCGGNNKLHINKDSGQWSCKGGDCGKSGNVHTFIRDWYKAKSEEKHSGNAKRLADLATNRGMPVTALKKMGMVYLNEVDRWAIPVYNLDNKIVNIRFYKPGQKTIALTGMPTTLGGMEDYKKDDTSDIYICEGEWDAAALKLILEKAEISATILWVPGADVFKKEWVEYFEGRNIIFCYDNDPAGERGTQRAASKIYDTAKSLRYIKWPSDLPKKFDVRDFYIRDGDFGVLSELIDTYVYLEDKEATQTVAQLPHISERKICFDDVVKIFEKHMKLTDDMKMALKLICGVVYSNNFEGLPLWVHITAPPGTGKTELLTSLSDCCNAVIRSTITPRSLVSGFSLPGGKDPSLIPSLFGKTFVLKDYTEILQMNRGDKEEVDGILRGAYDGTVGKDFGNGVKRHYTGTFSLLTGVTHEIFAEAHTALGERFLIFHMVKGVDFDADDIILQALRSSGHETSMKSELAAAMKALLEFRFDEKDIPELNDTWLMKIICLAQVVAKLRASVARDFREEKVLYRPQPEMGTRLAKQFQKAMRSMGVTNHDLTAGELDYKATVRTALDTCKGFNLEITQFVAEKGGGVSAKEISDGIGIPLTSIRMALEDLEWVKVLESYVEVVEDAGAGRPKKMYSLTETTQKHWAGAGLEKAKEIMSEKPRPRLKWKKKPKAGSGDKTPEIDGD
jgi:hypothetical protein